jgi:hypothetical protein
MDILAGLKDKVRFIERFYSIASGPFNETIRKIEAEEEPFVPPYFDPETSEDLEPPYLEEWDEAKESVNLVGQAALTLVQSALRQYLDGFVSLSNRAAPAGSGNWLARYKKFFLNEYGIDWEAGPVSTVDLEEINLARNDIQHTGDSFGMDRRQSKDHQLRFPEGIFINYVDKSFQRELPSPWGSRIDVTSYNLKEAVRRVESFCQFLDDNRPFS